jgi:hypothetical protein
MVEDSPDVMKENIIEGILKGQDAGTSVIQALRTNFSHAVDRYVKYGKDKYSPGLPQGDMTVGFVPLIPIFDILNLKEGSPVHIVEAALDTPEVDHIAHQYLRDNLGMDPATLIVAAPDFVPTGVLKYVDAEFRGGAGTISINFLDGVAPVSRNYTVPGAELYDEHYNVHYYMPNDASQTPLYWSYNPKLAIHAELGVSTGVYSDSTYLPIVILRSDKENLVDTLDGDLLNTSKKMMGTLGMDLQGITDSVMENPDINDIYDVMVMFAADIQSDSPTTLRYLFDYFLTLSVRTKSTKQLWDESLSTKQVGAKTTRRTVLVHRPTTKISIADRDARMQFEYNYIDVQIVEGNLGPIGTTTRTNVATLPKNSSPTSEYILRQQINTTQYQQVLVHGLVHTGRPHSNKVVVTGLDGSLKDDAMFIIPLAMSLVDSFTEETLERADLYYDCMVMVVHAVVKTSWEWYEDPLFFKLIQIVLIIVAIVFFQPEIATLGELLVYVGTQIAIKIAVDFLVNTIGGDLALILAAIATIVAISTGNLDMVLTTMPTAITLLQVVLAVTVSVSGYYEDKMEDLISESETVIEEQERLTEQLVASQDLLDSNGNIDPLYVLEHQYKWLPEEGPEAFYFRTLHNNPGLIGFDALRGWHDSALQLPKGTDLSNKYV